MSLVVFPIPSALIVLPCPSCGQQLGTVLHQCREQPEPSASGRQFSLSIVLSEGDRTRQVPRSAFKTPTGAASWHAVVYACFLRHWFLFGVVSPMSLHTAATTVVRLPAQSPLSIVVCRREWDDDVEEADNGDNNDDVMIMAVMSCCWRARLKLAISPSSIVAAAELLLSPVVAALCSMLHETYVSNWENSAESN